MVMKYLTSVSDEYIVDYPVDQNEEDVGFTFRWTKKCKTQSLEEEFRSYIKSPPERYTTDPLQWWNSQKKSYPALSEVAKSVLSIPASSAASEREFSKARIVMPWNRCRLDPDTLKALMCLRHWLKIEELDQLEGLTNELDPI
jgi:hypothetical protein